MRQAKRRPRLVVSLVCIWSPIEFWGVASGFLADKPSTKPYSCPLDSWSSRSFKTNRSRRPHPLRFRASTTTSVHRSARNDTAATQQTQAQMAKESSSSASDSCPYKSVSDLNLQLTHLVGQAADFRNSNVIARAAECEEEWRKCTSGSYCTFAPDTKSFNCVLEAWARCSQTLAEHRNDLNTGKIATELPSVPVYTPVDAADRALAILQEQERLLEASEDNHVAFPDTMSYNHVMDAYAKCRNPKAPRKVQELLDQLEKSPTLQSDTYSWNALIEAYAFSEDPDRFTTLNRIWKNMQKAGEDPASPVRTTARTVNAILLAYSRRVPDDFAKTRRHADICLRMFKEMKAKHKRTRDPADQPDFMSYTAVIHALSNCGTQKTAETASALFRELKDLHEKSGRDRFQPTRYTYTVVILAWGRTSTPDSAERAEAILEELLDDDGVSPNAKCFTAAISAWARSRDVQKGARALKLIKRMKALQKRYPEVAPNLISYNAALDACSRTKGTETQQTAALKLAFALFKAIEVDPQLQPDHTIFSTLLRATGFLMPRGDERNSIAKAVFEKAVVAGQVDRGVIKALQGAVDAELLNSLLAPMTNEFGAIVHKNMPSSWRRRASP